MADKEKLDQLFNLKASFPTKEETRAFFEAAEKNDLKALGNIIDKWPDAPKKWVSGNDPVIVEWRTPKRIAPGWARTIPIQCILV